MSDDQISVRIVGDASSAVAATNASADAVQRASTTMREGLNNVQTKAREAFTGLTESSQSAAGAVGESSARMSASMKQVEASSAQVRFAMRDLGFQISDIGTQFAMGTSPMMIFAQQGSQVVGAIGMMQKEASGLIGFLGGIWGQTIMAAVSVLGVMAGKLYDTADAAGHAESALDRMIAKYRQVNEERFKYANAGQSLDKLREEQRQLQELVKVKPYASDPNAMPWNSTYGLGGAKRRLKELSGIINEAQDAIVNERLSGVTVERTLRPDRGGSAPRSRAAGDNGAAAARLAAAAEREAEQDAVNAARAQEQNAINTARTEVDLSRMVLQAKLEGINTARQLGEITAQEALSRKAEVNDQMRELDLKLENDQYNARLKSLQDQRDAYKVGTNEFRSYNRQILVLDNAHRAQIRILDQKDAQAKRQQEIQELLLKRQTFQQISGAYAQQIARMVTLQQGFATTVRGMFNSLLGLVENVVARMVQRWILGLLAQDAASKAFQFKEVARSAKTAAANAWAATSKIPIVGPFLAPIAAATAFAGVMAFSAKQGYDVPDMAGPGIDGRGGQVGIVHPREMVLPADIADRFRSGGAGGDVHLHVSAMDSRDVKRFLMDNKAHVAGALRKHVRDGGR